MDVFVNGGGLARRTARADVRARAPHLDPGRSARFEVDLPVRVDEGSRPPPRDGRRQD